MAGTKGPEETLKALRESERRLSRSQALAHVGDWEWELATNAVHWSDELYRIYGYEPREIAPDYNLIVQQMHPDSKEEFLQAIDAALKGEKPFELDYTFFRQDGSEAILHTIGQVFRDKFGAPVRMAGIVQDVTERKFAEMQLQASENKCRTIFDKANDGILIVDTEEKTFVEANPAICAMLGCSREELLTMGVVDIHQAADLPAILNVFEKQRRGEISLAENIPVKRKDGTLFFADINTAVVSMGEKLCMVGIFRDITERRRAEQELKAQKKRLDESQRIAQIGNFEHNVVTNQAFWSDEMFRLLGLDPEKDNEDFDLFFNMVHPDDQPLLQKAIEETLQSNKHFSIDYRLTLKDGRARILRAIAELMPDSSGKKVILSGTAQDITERKLAEDILYEKNTMLQTLIHAIPDMVFFKDIHGRYLLANKAMEETLGLGREELIGMTDEELLPPEVAEKCNRSDAEAIERGGPVSSDEWYSNRNGETRFLDVVKAPIRDSNGDLKGLVVVSRDITERKLAEEKIQKNEEYIRNILDTVDEGFIVVDRNYRILTANHAYCESIGMHHDKVIGRHCYEVSHNRFSPCYEGGEECSVKKAFSSGIPQSAYHRHEDVDGNAIYVETKAFPILDASGTIIQAIETVNDITEKRLLEEERLKVQKLEAIGTLAGGIAHDFNNLLQGVFGYLSLAKMVSGQNKEGIASLEEAEKALHLSVKLTNQLLTFSKGGKPVKKTTNLQTVIDNAARFSLSGSSTIYSIANGENLWPVEADEGQITQVIQNIILNAVQAMPKGGRVEISMRNLLATDPELPEGLNAGRYVEVAIRDQGVGIQWEDLSRIFDPYFTTKEKGNGLGLATSYSIIKNHGGAVKVDSTPGEGTTFFIYLPASELVYPQAHQKQEVNDPTRPGKILVMDDESMICDVATALLGMLGHEVDFAMNGEETIAKYQAAIQSGKPFDLVILDLTIRGGIGGTETLRKLSAIDPRVKAVVSSGYADNAVVANYRDYGFTAFLNKPYSMDGLRNVLNAVLNQN
jgi:two-component system cell cycle sensor histidine kinase/response regulator CckA